MRYTKVFTQSRFQTRAQNNFSVDNKEKSVFLGSRNETRQRSALVGKVLEHGKIANVLDYSLFCDVSFPHVIGIFGSRGSGKSFDLGVLIEGIFLSDNLTPSSVTDAAIVFDVQDQFWTLGYSPQASLEIDQEQLRDLKRWGLEPCAIPNVKVLVPDESDTSVPHATPLSLAADQLSVGDWLAILELERFSAMGQALLALLEEGGALPPGQLADSCAGSVAMSRFQQATVDGLSWRLRGLEASGVIKTKGLLIDELLRPGTLSVVLMRNLDDAVRGLIVGVISRLVSDRMGRVQQARKVALRTGSAAEDTSNLTGRLWMVLDEAHVLVPSDGATAATAPLIDYVKRGRDAGLSLVFATQQPSAVNTKLMSQVDLTFTHMLGFDADLNAAVARMPTRSTIDYDVDNERASSISDVIRSLGPGEAILADSSSGRVLVARIRPRVTAHGGATPK
ncbi:DUF87 domain-containing protein [Rhizobium leguminosarum bv. viciae]|uniref:ATP-binding protein n=1 Tax=Rhizobium leguminosarum TaxID=384 RepID=UPI00144154B2|nr:DUF87 domain-containing protein [Rhizobium leguminosarum]NKK18074.1 DUF87 domain-containing protein [Rhizobium leguminosarum bv. viciae]